jgi:GR25 family glycosyltransferase involved in LPS biosynthesis
MKLYDGYNNDISHKLVKRDNGVYFKPVVTDTYYTNIECEIYNYTGVNHICDKNVYLINLHSRYYNYPRSNKLLQSICVDHVRFEAIDGNNGEYDEVYELYTKFPFTELEKRLRRKALISKGALGCLLSMKTIFEYALRDNAKYLCVVEDDIMVKKMFDFEKVSNVIIKTSGFNILKFGSSDRCFNECGLSNEDFYDCTIESNGGFFNIYNRDAIKYYYNIMCKHDTPLDLSTRDHIGNKYYVVFPNLIIANLDHTSSITGLVRTHQYSVFGWNPEEFDYE